MIYPNADKLENWGSKYSLVILAAQRAKQIKQGAKPLIKTDSANPLTVALEEIAAGAITCSVPNTDKPLVVHERQEAAELLSPSAEPGSEVGAEFEHADEAESAEPALVDDEEDHETGSEENEDMEDKEKDEDLALLADDEDEDDEGEECDTDDEDDGDVAVLAEEIPPRKPRKRGGKSAPVDESSAEPAVDTDTDEHIEDPDEESQD